jgi:hypothetical protein
MELMAFIAALMFPQKKKKKSKDTMTQLYLILTPVLCYLTTALTILMYVQCG